MNYDSSYQANVSQPRSPPYQPIGGGGSKQDKRHDQGNKGMRDSKKDDRGSEYDHRKEEILHRLKDIPVFSHEVGPTVSDLNSGMDIQQRVFRQT